MSGQAELRSQLCTLAHTACTPADLHQRNDALRQAFLAFGSETPDNLNCVQHIEYGNVQNRDHGPKRICGLKVKDTSVLVSDVMYAIEDKVDDIVRSSYPNLNEAQRDAVLRTIMLVLLSLEQWEVGS
jgi:hypothetical protein